MDDLIESFARNCDMTDYTQVAELLCLLAADCKDLEGRYLAFKIEPALALQMAKTYVRATKK